MNSTKKVRIMALIAAVMTALFGFYTVKNQQDTQGKLITVIKAIGDIPEGTLISADMLQYGQVSDKDYVANSAVNAEQVVGKYALSNIYAGETVVSNRLADEERDSASAFSYKIPEGMRTATITIDATSSVGGLLKVGDHVDVMASYSDTEGKPSVKYLDTDVEIAALDKTTTSTATTNSDGSTSSTTAEFTSVTLFVKPEMAKAIVWTQANGKLVLSLRSPDEESNPDSSSVTAAEVDGL